MKSFASDNNAPVHDAVMRAMLEVNQGDTIGYGNDVYTLAAEQRFREVFGKNTSVYFMLTGTGANVAALQHITRPYHAILCSDKAHLENDECGAPEKFTGCKLLRLPSEDGKIRVEQMLPLMHSVGFEHHAQPKVISITQATELGRVYRPAEIQQIAKFAKDNGLWLHMDGARLANAAASLGVSLADLTHACGVDVLSFGGTKNGAMFAEALVFFNASLAEAFKYTRKQSMQLMSKMRYTSAQFNALLNNDLWLHNAMHANAMAARLAEKIRNVEEISLTQEVETNAVFAIVPHASIEMLQRKYFFYIWDHSRNEVRWMTAFNTTEADVDAFADAIKDAVRRA
ncbi:MAG: low specificity L-threonine aldolase [Bacteroidales bacterium]|nr:low specificity L-threonine aldolase [Bacteroidales bacterium]